MTAASQTRGAARARPIPAPLSALSAGELADYRFARKSGLSRDEALSAAGRRDLTGQRSPLARHRAAAARAARAAAQEERV